MKKFVFIALISNLSIDFQNVRGFQLKQHGIMDKLLAE
jgi:hypothetical protein